MKENIKKIINLIILIVIAIGCFVFVKSIPSFLIGKAETISKVEVADTQKAGSGGTLPVIWGDTLFKVQVAGMDYFRLIGGGYEQLYCATKGGSLSQIGSCTKSDVDNYVSAHSNDSWSHHWSFSAISNISSYAYYEPVETRTATDVEAFVLTWPSGGSWNAYDAIKQEAVWDLPTLNNNKKEPKPSTAGTYAEMLEIYANNYAVYKAELDSNNGKIVKADKTVKDDVRKNSSQNTNEYIVGPFKIDYVQGFYAGLAYGGISDMYIVGEKTSRIEIESFIIDGVEYTATKEGYFLQIPDDDLYTPTDLYMIDDTTPIYPQPNQEFYVKYKATTDEQINKLHVDFKYMTTEATITYLQAFQYLSNFSYGDYDYHCDSDHTEERECPNPWCDETYTAYNVNLDDDCCHGVRVTSAYTSRISLGNFQRQLSAVGTRTLHTESLDITIPEHKEPEQIEANANPPAKNLQIKLAGHVWEDEDSGKESLPNGTMDDGESRLGGIEVILHYASNGAVVKKTVTDNNGYYEFNDLNAQVKYYIEFKYDGQIYQATTYKDTGSNTIKMAGSNALEISSERTALNNRFAEIMSAPASYTRPDGSTNTVYIINQTSSETPYGIKEVYDYIKEQAIASKNYDSALSAARAEYGDSKVNFIEDCRISSYTNLDGTLYPIYNKFVESAEGKTLAETDKKTGETINVYYSPLYPLHINIDFGLNRRETVDLAINKDVEKVTVEINGKTQTYTYDTLDKFKCNSCNYEGKIEDLIYDSITGELRCPQCNKTDIQESWDIGVRLSDVYYNTNYSRELYASDYNYKVSNYGDTTAQNAYGKYHDDKIDDELNVYVTYKITVRNQSQSVLGEITELVDYYDEDYEYVDERSYIQIKYGNDSIDDDSLAKPGTYAVGATDTSRYANYENAVTKIDGYNNLYVQGLAGKKLSAGQTAYIYLTFKVTKENKDGEDWIKLDEEVGLDENGKVVSLGVGKENIAEVNGFKSYYRNGTEIPNVGKVSGYSTTPGLVDYDSVPGNINKNDVPKDGTIKYSNFEDDTDKAPNIRLILYRDENGEFLVRTIDGVSWEDERNVINNEQVTTVANGIKDENEKAINGVTVQLVELMDNGTEYVWKQFSTGQNAIDINDVYTPVIGTIGYGKEEDRTIKEIPADTDTTEGKYIFKSYAPGNYIVRFIYGDTVKTVLPNSSTDVTSLYGATGQNEKSYNGQDYKSTTYQEKIEQSNTNDVYNNNTSGSFTYNITASDANTNVSDAKDIYTDDNQYINDYYRNNLKLNSREDVINYSNTDVTNYIAEVLASSEKLPLNTTEVKTKLDELMTETQMTAETGKIDVELEYDTNTTPDQTVNNKSSYNITNVNLGLEERPKAQLSIDKQVTNVKLTLADGSTLFDANGQTTNVIWRKHSPYNFDDVYTDNKLNQIAQIRAINANDATFGLIQLSMDEELMHGATIKISYKITVTNVGEVDYKDNQFYYTGITSDLTTVVTTTANKVVDYVANNLQFYAVDNSAWQTISQNELLDNGLVNMTLKNEVEQYNTIIVTDDSDSKIATTALVPKLYDENRSSVSDDLILTQLITTENSTDDLTYRNIVEIVKTSNDVGRRNTYSVVGNQDPTQEPAEVDSNKAQIVKILPPFGSTGTIYVVAITVLLACVVLAGGIVFIKKKVLR